MTEPRDPFETWLHTQVEPLPPPPGTFERIRKRARRRKVKRAVMSAASAGAAAGLIVLAVIALPRVVPSVLHMNGNTVSASLPSKHSAPPRHSDKPRQSAPATASTAPATSVGTPPPATGPVPRNFAPASVTFVSLHTGFVIGQAGTPGKCANANPYICTSVARTDNAGMSWLGVHAPPTTGPDGGAGVSQIRFRNTNGWAFGPALWVTHNGGYTWTRESTHGLRVTSLETAGTEAFAVFAKCTGSGPDFAAGCTRFWLYSSFEGSDTWAPVPGMSEFGVTGAAGAGTDSPNPGGVNPGGPNQGAGSAAIVLTKAQGYLYTPSGTLLSGPVSGGSPWTAVGSSALPCTPGAAAASGRPSGGQLAASQPGALALACPGSGNQELIYTSADGGATWQLAGTTTVAGTATSLAAGTGGVLTLATTQGLYTSRDGGQHWQLTQREVTGGFSYVGLTSSTQGVAVPADPGRYQAVWVTRDAGMDWQKSPVRGG